MSMADPYLIKKYSSRRLYDVEAGRFVTFGDVDQLIRHGRTIKVIDAKGRDATRGVLLQILTEREEGREPMLSVEILHEMVRLYGDVMQGPFMRFLDQGFVMMRKQREAWLSTLPEAFRQGTSSNLSELLDQQAKWWQTAQSTWLGGARKGSAKGEP